MITEYICGTFNDGFVDIFGHIFGITANEKDCLILLVEKEFDEILSIFSNRILQKKN